MKEINKVHLILIMALFIPLSASAAERINESKVNLNDSKVTKEEEELDDAQTKKANRFAERQGFSEFILADSQLD